MSLFMQNGQQKSVLFADGLKIGKKTKLSSATGIYTTYLILYKHMHLELK